MKKKRHSKTMWWGHTQFMAGAFVAGAGYFTPANFPNFPAWAYGLAVMGAGVLTYWLRSKTSLPLEKK